MCASWSPRTKKKKKAQAGNDSSNLLPKSSHATGKIHQQPEITVEADTEDVEIKGLSAEIPELSKVPPVRPGAGGGLFLAC